MESTPRLITSSGYNRVLIDVHHNMGLNQRKNYLRARFSGNLCKSKDNNTESK